MKKRILAAFAALCLTLPLLAAPALALPKDVTIVKVPSSIGVPQRAPSEGLIPVSTPENATTVGYMDFNGKLVLPIKYFKGGDFHDGRAIFEYNKLYGVIDKTGAIVVPAMYEQTGYDFYGGMLAVRKDKKWGMIDTSGKAVIPLMYDEIAKTYDYDEGWHFVSGLLDVKRNGKWGAIDKQNHVAIPFLYTELDRYGDLYIAAKPVVENGKSVVRWGVIDLSGNTVVPFVYEKLRAPKEGALPFQKGGKWGMYDLNTKKELVAATYEEVDPYDNGFALVKKNDKLGYVNRAGVEVVATEYTHVGSGFHEGVAVVAKRPTDQFEGFWGYVDSTGKPLTGFTHLDAQEFSEGLGCLTDGTNNTRYGAINAKGELVIPYQFDGLYKFTYGRAVFMKFNGESAKQGYVDKTGKIIMPASFTYVDYFNDYGVPGGEPYTMVSYDYMEWGNAYKAKYFIINPAGQQVKPYGFASIRPFYAGIAEAHDQYFQHDPVGYVIDNSYKAPVDPNPNRTVTFPCNKSNILINGKPVSFEGYTLSGSNYFKLRDLAMALNGTPGQFNVTWDNAKASVNIVPGEAYVPVGGELAAGDGQAKGFELSTSKTCIMGQEADLAPITTGGNNYYMLRDIMERVGVTVGWDGATNTITLTTKTAEEARAEGQPVTGTLQAGVYSIKAPTNRSIGLSVSGASTSAGGKITLYTTTDENHYKFTVTGVGDGTYTISPLHSNLMLTSPREKGKGLTQQKADGSDAQTFTITYQGNGSYRIQDCDGLYLAANAGKIEKNNPIILWTKVEESGQTFVFEQK